MKNVYTPYSYGAFQKLFNSNLKTWYNLKATGSNFHIWNPPGILFTKLGYRPQYPTEDQWLFNDGKPLQIQMGIQNGDFLSYHSFQDHSTNWIGIDSDPQRIFSTLYQVCRKCDLNPETQMMPNIKLVQGDPRWIYSALPHNSVHSIHITFPPVTEEVVECELTSRPIRRSFVSPRFLRNLYDILVPEGEIFMTTDNFEVLLTILMCFKGDNSHFSSALPSPFFTTKCDAHYINWVNANNSRQRDVLTSNATKIDVSLPPNFDEKYVTANTRIGKKILYEINIGDATTSPTKVSLYTPKIDALCNFTKNIKISTKKNDHQHFILKNASHENLQSHTHQKLQQDILRVLEQTGENSSPLYHLHFVKLISSLPNQNFHPHLHNQTHALIE